MPGVLALTVSAVGQNGKYDQTSRFSWQVQPPVPTAEIRGIPPHSDESLARHAWRTVLLMNHGKNNFNYITVYPEFTLLITSHSPAKSTR